MIVVLPDAPRITSLDNGDAEVSVSVTEDNHETSPVTAKGPSSLVTVKVLINGDTWVFTATATSADRTSPPSAPSGGLNVGVPPVSQRGPADGVVGRAYSSPFVITGAPPSTVTQIS